MNVKPVPALESDPPVDPPADPAAGQPGDVPRDPVAIGGAVHDGGSAGDPAGDGAGSSGAQADEGKGTGFMAVLQSVAAAGIGVQSSKNRQRDFERGKPVHFIIGGLIGTALFLLAVWLFVRVLLATAPG